VIDGKMIGAKTNSDEQVLMEDLLSYSPIDFYKKMYGIYIPAHEILHRTNYEWFARLSEKQIMKSNLTLCKYFKRVFHKEGFFLKKTHDPVNGAEPQISPAADWIGFWKVPSNTPLWGMKPYNLGNYVPRA
jgi:hypothetical protein